MTFEAREASIELGEPIMLAQFALGMKSWYFDAADQDLTYDGNTYLSLPGGMQLSRIQDSGEFAKNNVKMTVDRLHPIAELWRVSPPTAVCAIILKEIHLAEVDDSVAWLGHVSNVSWGESGTADILLSPGTTAMASNGLRRLWQKGCPHVLYGKQCGLDPETNAFDATITANDGLTLTAAEFDNGSKLAGGFISWTDVDGVTDWRFIMSRTGTSVRTMTRAPLLEVGTVVRVYVGCDHTITRCAELNNTDNMGGIPYFQGKNPFNGTMVY